MKPAMKTASGATMTLLPGTAMALPGGAYHAATHSNGFIYVYCCFAIFEVCKYFLWIHHGSTMEAP